MNTTARNLLLAGPLALAFTLTAAPAATALDNDGPVIVMPPAEPDPVPTDIAQPDPQPEPDPAPDGPDEVAQPDEPKPPKGPGDIAQPEDEVDPHGPDDIAQPEDEVGPEGPDDLTAPEDCPTHGVDCDGKDEGDEPEAGEPEPYFPLDTDDYGDADLPGDEVDLPTRIDAGEADAAVDGEDAGQGWLYAMAAAVLAAITAVMARFVRRS